MLFLTGLPLFFLELSIGQYVGRGPTKVFSSLGPAFQGVGYAAVVVVALLAIYYNMIIAWTIYYLVAGFASELPWAKCGETILTSRDCYSFEQDQICYNSNNETMFWDRKCKTVSEL